MLKKTKYLYDDDEKKRRAAAKKIIDDIFKAIYGDDLDIIQKEVEERSMNKDPLFEENSIGYIYFLIPKLILKKLLELCESTRKRRKT